MMMEEEESRKELTTCIHAHHIETNPYSHDSELIYIPVCNQCYIDCEIEGIEVYSRKGIEIEMEIEFAQFKV